MFKNFTKMPKCETCQKSPCLVTMICLHQHVVTVFTKQDNKIKNQRQIFLENLLDTSDYWFKWIETFMTMDKNM